MVRVLRTFAVALALALALVALARWTSAPRERAAAVVGGEGVGPDSSGVRDDDPVRAGGRARVAAREASPSTATLGAAGLVVLGTVVDPSGAPIAGARVFAFPRAIRGPPGLRPGQSARPCARGVTDRDGRFALPVGNAIGFCGVLALADGFATGLRNQLPDFDTRFRLEERATVIGDVTGGAEGLALRWTGPRFDGESLSSRAWDVLDPEGGSYEVDDLPLGGTLDLLVAPRGAVAWVERISIADPLTRHDLVLTGAYALVGRLRDDDGRAVAGADVGARSVDGTVTTAKSRLDGSFRLVFDGSLAEALRTLEEDGVFSDVFQGLTVEVVREGFPTHAWHIASVVLAEGELELLRGGQVIGCVYDSEGPVPDVRVEWLQGTQFAQRPFDGASLVARVGGATTDGNGVFLLPDAVPGLPDSAIVVTAPDGRTATVFGPTDGDPVAPQRPGQVVHPGLRLPSGPAVQGRVVWANCGCSPGPLADSSAVEDFFRALRADVSIARPDGSDEHTARVDATRTFSFEGLEPGHWVVRARDRDHPDSVSPEKHVRVPAGGGVDFLVLRIFPEGFALDGRVLDSAGAPAAGLHVVSRPMLGSWARPDDDVIQCHDLDGKTDENGGLELRVTPYGSLPTVLETVLEPARVRLAVSAPERPFVWTLPELVRVRLRAGWIPARPDRRVVWKGPGPDDHGESGLPEPDGAGWIDTRLPRGVLTLVVRGARTPYGGTWPGVRVAPGPDGTAVVDLAP